MILEKVKNTIKRYKLLKKNDLVIVGVSGGADSTALLYLLSSLKDEFGLILHIAHLDHMLRKDSAKERKFVEGLARKFNLAITVGRINVKKLALPGGSIEEISRNARLRFFFKLARRIKADKIALGHNLGDQAETVLMRLLRGSGLQGLSAMMPRKDISGYQIIRPLIEVDRKEIESFLKKKGVRPCQDSSNLSQAYFRNKIRNKLLPLLEKEYNRNIKRILSHSAENIACDYDYLNAAATEVFRRIGPRINLKRFIKLHPAIQRMVLRMNIAKLSGSTRRIVFRHMEELKDLIFNRPLNSVVDLPKGISVCKKKFALVFYRRR
jgi:tRNA(Ile)-lysidine synthase